VRPRCWGACSTSDHNDADVAFATDMIAHRQGAITMAGEVRDDGKHHGLAELAADIEAVQRVEVKDLERWRDAV
jgi:uncharacterized protein (DUF305 family)